jgi:phosphoglycerate dehydrogenase-like enzyme
MIPSTLFVGQAANLPLAFPHELRSEINAHARILPGEFEGDAWRDHTEVLREADFLFATWGMPKLDSDFLAAAPRLKVVFYAAGTVKGFVTEESYARGILISSAWGANAIPVAEYAHAAILLSLKSFWRFARQPAGMKFSREKISIPGAYKTQVGLVSLGAIGRSVAARLASSEVEILAHDPFIEPQVAALLGVTSVSLEELFARSDVISIHAPLLPETENLVTGALIRSMKQGATFINTARGALVHEAGLCAVLRERPDLTAILDVTQPEPPSADAPLRTLENVILTPHIAGSLGGEITRMGRWMVDEMRLFLNGEPLRHGVTREMLARMA